MQRRLLAAVGTLTLLVTVAIAVVANRDASGGSQAVLVATERDQVSETIQRSTVSTLELEPVRGGTALPPTTATPTTAAEPAEPPETTTTTAPPAVEAEGTAFSPTSDSAPRAAADGECRSMASPGWTAKDCGVAAGRSGPFTWLTETKDAARRALLLERSEVGQWRPSLAAVDESGGRWSEIKARVAEGPDGAGDQIVGVGFRARSGGALSVDLIRDGKVAAHVELAKGSARVSRAQLDTWSAQADGTYLHQVIRWSAQAWRVVDSEVVSGALVPPSHL